MQDRWEREQDLKYEALKAKKERGRRTIRNVAVQLGFILIPNAIAWVSYAMFVSKVITGKMLDGQPITGIVLTFAAIAQLAVIIFCSCLYLKNAEENRALLAASREEGFSATAYFASTMKRMGWILPLTYFIFQIPFMLYYAVLGYAYGVETLFAKFYTPQLFGIALIGTGMRFVDALLGIVLNTVVLLIVYVIVVYLTQRKWLKERIRG
jgi:hypothetical protein